VCGRSTRRDGSPLRCEVRFVEGDGNVESSAERNARVVSRTSIPGRDLVGRASNVVSTVVLDVAGVSVHSNLPRALARPTRSLGPSGLDVGHVSSRATGAVSVVTGSRSLPSDVCCSAGTIDLGSVSSRSSCVCGKLFVNGDRGLSASWRSLRVLSGVLLVESPA